MKEKQIVHSKVASEAPNTFKLLKSQIQIP